MSVGFLLVECAWSLRLFTEQQWSDGDLLRRCFTELGVDVCIEGDLYSFKYNVRLFFLSDAVPAV